MINLKKEYEKYQNKYSLPDYDGIDDEFELLYITDIAEIKFPLRFMRRRMNDKLVWICNIIQSIIQPNPSSIINLEESNFFSKENKIHLSNILRELMQIERRSLALDINQNEKEDAELIKEIYKVYKKLKPDINKISEKMLECWKTERKLEKGHYFG